MIRSSLRDIGPIVGLVLNLSNASCVSPQRSQIGDPIKMMPNPPVTTEGSNLTGQSRPGRILVARLIPGTDVRKWIEDWAAKESIRAGVVVSAVGSLTVSSIRFANEEKTTSLDGPFEIVSLTGTIAESGVHLHLSVADSKGRTTGGHMGAGNLVRTTLELAVQELPDLEMIRAKDERTGFNELFLKSVPVKK